MNKFKICFYSIFFRLKYCKLYAVFYSFTGSDIVVVVKEALIEPLRMIEKATHYVKVSVC